MRYCLPVGSKGKKEGAGRGRGNQEYGEFRGCLRLRLRNLNIYKTK